MIMGVFNIRSGTEPLPDVMEVLLDRPAHRVWRYSRVVSASSLDRAPTDTLERHILGVSMELERI